MIDHEVVICQFLNAAADASLRIAVQGQRIQARRET